MQPAVESSKRQRVVTRAQTSLRFCCGKSSHTSLVVCGFFPLGSFEMVEDGEEVTPRMGVVLDMSRNEPVQANRRRSSLQDRFQDCCDDLQEACSYATIAFMLLIFIVLVIVLAFTWPYYPEYATGEKCSSSKCLKIAATVSWFLYILFLEMIATVFTLRIQLWGSIIKTVVVINEINYYEFSLICWIWNVKTVWFSDFGSTFLIFTKNNMCTSVIIIKKKYNLRHIWKKCFFVNFNIDKSNDFIIFFY